MDGPDPLQQPRLRDRMSGRRTMSPSVVAGLRHAEHACHCGDREDGLIRAHELEDPGRYRSGFASKPGSHSRENVALLARFLPEALMADASRNFIV